MSDLPSNLPIVSRSEVEDRKNYRDYRQELRYDFFYSCAYCSTTELEAWGIRFEIDHYLPGSVVPKLYAKYSNLMYSCEQCNGRKWGFCPSDSDKENGHYVIRIDEEDPRVHFVSKGDRIEGATPTGIFNEKILDLNRQTLRRIRSIRRKIWESNQYLINGMRELLGIRMDQIPKEIRMNFLNNKNIMTSGYDKLINMTNDFVRECSRSPLLDEDPEAKKRLKIRRQYLDEIRAVNEKSFLPSIDSLVPKNKKKRKK